MISSHQFFKFCKCNKNIIIWQIIFDRMWRKYVWPAMWRTMWILLWRTAVSSRNRSLFHRMWLGFLWSQMWYRYVWRKVKLCWREIMINYILFFLSVCPSGWYGRNCSQQCGQHCIPSCDRFTGVCELGCKPGWKGQFCETSNFLLIHQ